MKEKGWAAGIQNRIYNTGDGGITWNRPNLLPSASYTSIFFIDSLTGWTVGANGVILKTTSGGVLTNFTNTSIEIPDKYFLSQNYPNPFNPATNLEFGIPELGFVSLKVYDVLGDEVKTLENEIKPAGNYEIEFDGSHLSSGIYFYSLLIDGNIIDTKRMILLK
ncbi:MAG: T9SS type A sorting domain-containing protein [Ignavibacteria bacterium]|nr:T9SS type A sorting domain-containing protein [Ignavibacteria bacterium]